MESLGLGGLGAGHMFVASECVATPMQQLLGSNYLQMGKTSEWQASVPLWQRQQSNEVLVTTWALTFRDCSRADKRDMRKRWCMMWCRQPSGECR
jgi:hypothetical protein